MHLRSRPSCLFGQLKHNRYPESLNNPNAGEAATSYFFETILFDN